jgi:hypothetical protein
MKNLPFLKTTAKQGIVLGLAFCLYTTSMWLTRLDTVHLNIGQYLDMAIILLPITIIFWAIKQETSIYRTSIAIRIGIAIYVGALSFLIYDPFLYVYHEFINPQWFDSVIELKKTELLEEGKTSEQIETAIKMMNDTNSSNSGLFKLPALIASVVILPTIIAIISFFLIKNKSKNSTID